VSIKKVVRKAAKKAANVVEDVAEDVIRDEIKDVIFPDAKTRNPERDVTVTATTGPEPSTTVTTEPVTVTTKVSKAIGGVVGNASGVLLVAGSLLLNPEFASALGRFTVGLARGEGGLGALAALVGAGLLAYRHRPGT
jgi:hypothetical protein